MLKLVSAFSARVVLDWQAPLRRFSLIWSRCFRGVIRFTWVLEIDPLVCRRHETLLHEPHKRRARSLRDDVLVPAIQRVRSAGVWG